MLSNLIFLFLCCDVQITSIFYQPHRSLHRICLCAFQWLSHFFAVERPNGFRLLVIFVRPSPFHEKLRRCETAVLPLAGSRQHCFLWAGVCTGGHSVCRELWSAIAGRGPPSVCFSSLPRKVYFLFLQEQKRAFCDVLKMPRVQLGISMHFAFFIVLFCCWATPLTFSCLAFLYVFGALENVSSGENIVKKVSQMHRPI